MGGKNNCFISWVSVSVCSAVAKIAYISHVHLIVYLSVKVASSRIQAFHTQILFRSRGEKLYSPIFLHGWGVQFFSTAAK